MPRYEQMFLHTPVVSKRNVFKSNGWNMIRFSLSKLQTIHHFAVRGIFVDKLLLFVNTTRIV